LDETEARITMNAEAEADILRIADSLQRRGLATVALMLVELAAPHDFIGEQTLYAVGPLLPTAQWRSTAREVAAILGDAERRALLQRLLARDA
jgi:hypothetical protein